MDYTGVFKNSGRILWRHKLLWLVGLLLMSGSLPGLAAGHFYLRLVFSLPTRLFESASPDEFFLPILDVLSNPTIVVGGAILFLFMFTIVWVLSTIGEVALIRSVADFDDGRSLSFRDMLGTGIRFLVRIIAIDTVIFLPLFLIVLLGMLILGGGMVFGILSLAGTGSNPDNLLPIGVITGLILVFLIVLSIPVAILSFMFRLFAFRSAVLEDLRTRPSIRRAWELIRANIGQIIIVFLLLYAISYAVGIVTSLLVFPFSIGGSLLLINPFSSGQFPDQGALNAFLLVIGLTSLISLIPNMFYRLFSSAVWTLTYQAWLREGAGQAEQAPQSVR